MPESGDDSVLERLMVDEPELVCVNKKTTEQYTMQIGLQFPVDFCAAGK